MRETVARPRIPAPRPGPPPEPAEPAAPPPDDPPRPHPARFWNLAVALASGAGVAVLGWRHRALSGDGLVYLRTVRQILAGNGPVLNVGERAEANTSTLWQWILVLVGKLTPGDLGFAAVIAGLACATAGVVIAVDATRRLYGAAGPRYGTGYVLPAGVCVLFAVPPFWDYTTTGLETGLGTLWLGVSWWLLVRCRTLHRPRGPVARHRGNRRTQWLLGTSAWFGLGPLVRPELALVTVVFIIAATIVTRPGWGIGLLRLCAAGALPVAYEILRAGYYGILVPMPALAEQAGTAQPGRGWHYVRDFLEPYWLYAPAGLGLIVLIMVLVRLTRRADAADARGDLVVPLTPVVAALLAGAYVVWIGGDFMHARMLLPVLFLGLMPVLVVPADLRLLPAVLGFAVYAVAVTGPWHPGAYRLPDGDKRTVLIRTNDIGLTGIHNPDHVADWTENFEAIPSAVREAIVGPDPVLVFFTPDQKTAYMMPLSDELVRKGFHVSVQGGYLGLMGFLVPLDERIVERWGPANTVAAHMEPVEGWRELPPGHRKDLGYAWMIAMDAAFASALPPLPYSELDRRRIDAARRALGCGDLKELLESTREPMGWARFWQNLVGSPARTTLVIPRDPFEAERKFCGKG